MAIQEHIDILLQGVEAWNNWRNENPKVQPDLSGIVLPHAELQRINFFQCDLTSASLIRANLDQAELRGSTLARSNFEGSNLREAKLRLSIINAVNFSNVNLRGADLKNILFRDVNLASSILDDADFTDSTVVGVIWGNIDLSKAKGLESIQHLGPSVMGIDTIYQSGGRIPEVFLKGVGVPENFITYMNSLVEQPIQFYSCFISYSRADKSFARRLHDTLQGRGIRCWLDEHQLLPGHDIFEEVDRGIRLWDKVLLCCSKDSLTSWWVDNEISTAFEKEQSMMKDRGRKIRALIPLDLDGYIFTEEWENGKAAQVKTRLAADFINWDQDNAKFEKEIERLIKALRTDEGREVPPESKL